MKRKKNEIIFSDENNKIYKFKDFFRLNKPDLKKLYETLEIKNNFASFRKYSYWFYLGKLGEKSYLFKELMMEFESYMTKFSLEELFKDLVITFDNIYFYLGLFHKVEFFRLSEQKKNLMELYRNNKILKANYKVKLEDLSHQLKTIESKQKIDFILTECRKDYKVWTKYMREIRDFADVNPKRAGDSIHDFISREILNNNILSSSVRDEMNRKLNKKPTSCRQLK